MADDLTYPQRVRVQLRAEGEDHWWTVFQITKTGVSLVRALTSPELLALNGTNKQPEDIIVRVNWADFEPRFGMKRAQLRRMLK